MEWLTEALSISVRWSSDLRLEISDTELKVLHSIRRKVSRWEGEKQVKELKTCLDQDNILNEVWQLKGHSIQSSKNSKQSILKHQGLANMKHWYRREEEFQWELNCKKKGLKKFLDLDSTNKNLELSKARSIAYILDYSKNFLKALDQANTK